MKASEWSSLARVTIFPESVMPLSRTSVILKTHGHRQWHPKAAVGKRSPFCPATLRSGGTVHNGGNRFVFDDE